MSIYLCGASAKDYFHYAQVVSVAIALGCAAFFFGASTLVLLCCRRRMQAPQASLFTVQRRGGAKTLAQQVVEPAQCEAAVDAIINKKSTSTDVFENQMRSKVLDVHEVSFNISAGSDNSFNATVPQVMAPYSPETSIFKLALAFNIGDGDPEAVSEVCEQLRQRGFVTVSHLRQATLPILESISTDPIVLRKLCYMVEYADMSADMDDEGFRFHEETKPYG